MMTPSLSHLLESRRATSYYITPWNDTAVPNIQSQQDIGQVDAFTAVPIFAGRPDFDSPMRFTCLDAISTDDTAVCSDTPAPIGGGGNTTVPSFDNLELIIQYTWPADQSDLDTGTAFLGTRVGYDCGSSPYMSFSGDDTSSGGSETIIVRIDEALQNGAWTDTATVFLRAGWYSPAGGSGPADARIALRDGITQQEVSGTGHFIVYDPGVQGECAATTVGQAVLTVTEDSAT